MTKIIVFGAGGLLGSHFCALYKDLVVPVTHEECDITNPIQVWKVLDDNRDADFVLNCAGIVPKAESDIFHMFEVNSHAPHYMAEACDDLFIRMIHVSTDCVYSGTIGNYDEVMVPRPTAYYGMSKLLGEVTRNNHLTIRTSFVGYPDPTRRGLLSWFVEEMEKGNTVSGWTNVFWNGLTTIELSYQIMNLIEECGVLEGFGQNLLHVHGQRLSKYDLLKTFARMYGYDESRIIPADEPKSDKTLKSIIGDFEQTPKTFETMLEEMKEKLCQFQLA